MLLHSVLGHRPLTLQMCMLHAMRKRAVKGSSVLCSVAWSCSRTFGVPWLGLCCTMRGLTGKPLLQIWRYQPWLRTMLLGVLQSLEAAEKPIIAIHVKSHGSTPVQVSLAATC